MPLDENKYETMRFMKCKTCGNVFAASLAGSKECPDCESHHISRFQPDGKEDLDTNSRTFAP